MISVHYSLAASLSLCLLSLGLLAAPTWAEEHIPKPGQFPPPKSGHYLAGELVTIDPINRRGGLRLDGDFIDDRYDKAQPQEFAMLPYGMLWYNGAPAELRDIPIGTHLHGTFYLPPKGEEKTIPPTKGPPQYGSKYNHALLLEDDFSFYQRRSQSWKINSIELQYDSSSKHFPLLNSKGQWRKTPARGKLNVVLVDADGKTVESGGEEIFGAQTFQIDRFTRIWIGRSFVEWEDLAAETRWETKDNWRILKPNNQAIQLGLTWSPEWRNRVFHVADIWFDKESRRAATERQRRVHRRHQLYRGLAAVVDHVEHQGGAKGIVTITLFGGMDPALYNEFTKDGSITLCAAENTLRTYWRNHDNKGGSVVEVKTISEPPFGSSGIQLRIQMSELLDGFRPGRIVRVDRQYWPRVKLPPEERLR